MAGFLNVWAAVPKHTPSATYDHVRLKTLENIAHRVLRDELVQGLYGFQTPNLPCYPHAVGALVRIAIHDHVRCRAVDVRSASRYNDVLRMNPQALRGALSEVNVTLS